MQFYLAEFKGLGQLRAALIQFVLAILVVGQVLASLVFPVRHIEGVSDCTVSQFIGELNG